VETLCGAAEGLLHVINDILDFSKIEAGKMTLEHIPFSLPRLLDELGKLMAPQAGAKGLALQCRAAASVPAVVVGDPARLRQVLVNLLGNAVKFTSQGSVTLEAARVDLESTDRRANLHFRVRDTGIGIPTSRQQRDQAVRRDWTWAEHLFSTGAGNGRTDLGREHAGRREHVPVYVRFRDSGDGESSGTDGRRCGRTTRSADSPGRRQSRKPETGHGDARQARSPGEGGSHGCGGCRGLGGRRI